MQNTIKRILDIGFILALSFLIGLNLIGLTLYGQVRIYESNSFILIIDWLFIGFVFIYGLFRLAELGYDSWSGK